MTGQAYSTGDTVSWINSDGDTMTGMVIEPYGDCAWCRRIEHIPVRVCPDVIHLHPRIDRLRRIES